MNDSELTDQEYLVLILALFETGEREWERVRDIEKELLSRAKQEFNMYFDKLFEKGIPSCTLQEGETLFRARQIKQSDMTKLGVDISTLEETLYKTVLSEEDIAKIQKVNETSDIQLTPLHMYMMKTIRNGGVSNEQKAKIDNVMKPYSNPGVYGFIEQESRIPPLNYRREGRLNIVSDAYLYLSVDRETAINEMRPSIGQTYSIAQFKANTDCKLVDLSGNYEGSSNTDSGLALVSRKVSEPNTDDSAEFYHITQHMAHLLQEKGYDGIKYKSALNLDKTNIMLFDETKVDFICSDIVSISEVKVKFETVFPISMEEQ